MYLYKKLEILYYKYYKPEMVGVKRSEFHDPEMYDSDLELMPRWKAIKQGYRICPNCFFIERPHGGLDDTNGELDWSKIT